MNYEKKQEKNKIVYNVVVDAEDYDKYCDEAFSQIAKQLEIKGFRKGHVPLNIAKQYVDSSDVLSHAANNCIEEKWFEIANKEKIEAISSANVKILKMAKGNPLEFEVEIETLPEIELPDYKKIAKDTPKKEIKVDEKEYKGALSWLIQSRAKFFQKNEKAKKGDLIEITYSSKDLDDNKEKKDRFILGKGHYIKELEEELLGVSKGDKKEIEIKDPKDNKKKIVLNVVIDSVQKMELPELNDDFAKSVGFESVEDLEKSIRNGIEQEKKMAEKQRIRTEVLEKIAKETKVDLPQVLIEREKEALLQNLKNRVSYELQTTFDDYLKQVKKTEEEIKKEFEKVAKERVKGFLILHEIEKKENVVVVEDEIDKKIEELAAQYPDKDKAREDLKNSDARYYIEDELKRDKIFSILGC